MLEQLPILAKEGRPLSRPVVPQERGPGLGRVGAISRNESSLRLDLKAGIAKSGLWVEDSGRSGFATGYDKNAIAPLCSTRWYESLVNSG